ncbi:glycosyl hydrolase [Actinomadura rifamycini]|uniref:glycosyl hydrolase n=1 Tax=Actinomadura rifamycini TaxID=31962 RepID=UPI000426D95B|nr:glycosyl hydrolase [Actinomadura rifamycini]
MTHPARPRRSRGAAALLAGAALCAATAAPAAGAGPARAASPSPSPAAAPATAPATGSAAPDGGRAPMLLGATAHGDADLAERERETGRPLGAVRVFRRWGEPVVDDFVRSRARSHVFFISVKARRPDGSKLRWADIASAPPGSAIDDEIRRQARALKELPGTVWFTFNHEPENGASTGMGRPREYTDAWRRVVAAFREEGARNVRYVWTMTDAAFGRDAARYYPGDDHVDAIGVDAYNWFTCRGRDEGWRPLGELIERHRRFGEKHPDEQLMILETGTVEDPADPGRKARWLAEATALLQRPEYRRYTALLHWDARHARPEGPTCAWDYRSSERSLRAWRAMAAAPVFGARVPCPPNCRDEEEDARGDALGPVLAAAGGAGVLAALGACGWLLLRSRRRSGAGGAGGAGSGPWGG